MMLAAERDVGPQLLTLYGLREQEAHELTEPIFRRWRPRARAPGDLIGGQVPVVRAELGYLDIVRVSIRLGNFRVFALGLCLGSARDLLDDRFNELLDDPATRVGNAEALLLLHDGANGVILRAPQVAFGWLRHYRWPPPLRSSRMILTISPTASERASLVCRARCS